MIPISSSLTMVYRCAIIIFVLSCYVHGLQTSVFNVTIRMPDVFSSKPDMLLCHAVRLNSVEAYIVRFEPKSSKTVAHHMMLYGCDEPASDLPYWPCGEEDDQGNIHKTCKHGPPRIIYAWALDGQPRSLPSDVGYRVGGKTGINYLVVGMHYKHKFYSGQTDDSGYVLQMTHDKQTFQVGYYILGTVGTIPPMTEEFHAETGCDYNANDTMYPIAYRTHSHNLGVVTSAYRYRDGKFTEIGRMSPQLPETFYDVTTTKMDIRKGDSLIARCTMSSQRNFETKIGSTNKDEMCNFYIMYYTTHQDNILEDKMCFRDHNKFNLKSYFKDLPENISSISGLPKFQRLDPFAAPLI